MRNLNLIGFAAISILLTLMLFSAAAVKAQVPSGSPTPVSTPEPPPTAGSEADPTKPMLFVTRNEYRDLKGGAWANTLLFRHDRFFFRNLRVKGGGRGFVFRFDVPFNTIHLGNKTKTGLGDIYTQLLLVPRISRRFALTVGSGFILPTATSNVLGQGKLVVAPLIVPLWYLGGRKRIVTLRVQHYISVAGKSNRANVNYTLADPFIGWAVGRKSWLFTDTELKWDWRTKLASGVTGIQFARMISARMGFWIKPEVPWGPGRQGGFNIKVGFYRFR